MKLRTGKRATITVTEAARVLQINPSRVYRLIAEGELPSSTYNSRTLVRSRDIEVYRTRRDKWLKLHGRKRKLLARA
jgi:predicted DNA-binding transcriptional regulator AlpA